MDTDSAEVSFHTPTVGLSSCKPRVHAQLCPSPAGAKGSGFPAGFGPEAWQGCEQFLSPQELELAAWAALGAHPLSASPLEMDPYLGSAHFHFIQL